MKSKEKTRNPGKGNRELSEAKAMRQLISEGDVRDGSEGAKKQNVDGALQKLRSKADLMPLRLFWPTNESVSFPTTHID